MPLGKRAVDDASATRGMVIEDGVCHEGHQQTNAIYRLATRIITRALMSKRDYLHGITRAAILRVCKK